MFDPNSTALDPHATMQPTERGEPSTPHTDASPTDAIDERRRQIATTPRDYLLQMPALILLNRLPTPALAVGSKGDIVYANPASAAFLGYDDPHDLTEQTLPGLMVGHADHSASDCVAELGAAAHTVTHWSHADGYHLHALVSQALLTRITDAVLLVTLTDLTDLLWNS